MRMLASWLRSQLMSADLYVASSEAVQNVWRKVQLFSIGVLHFLFSSDKRWPKLPSSSATAVAPSSSSAVSPRTALQYGSDALKTRKKRVLFVRHAESEWNVVFNRGVWWLAVVNFVRAVAREWLMLPTFDSIFIDSPLSRRGISQAKALHEDVSEKASPPEYIGSPPEHLLRYLSCPLPGSMVVASNLRRAIDTARIVSSSRLELPGERIHIISYLQEVGRNIDTLAISDAYGVPPRSLQNVIRDEKRHDELFNVSESHGNKAILGCARARLIAFARWACSQREDVLVVYGHSHWFRAFCQDFLPSHVEHPAKVEKLENCAVVTFELEERRTDGLNQYVIPPASFEYIR